MDEEMEVDSTAAEDEAGGNGGGAAVPTQCFWCKREGVCQIVTNQSEDGGETGFCTERCFSQFRRASFKKNRKCDYCFRPWKVTEVTALDPDSSKQFCS